MLIKPLISQRIVKRDEISLPKEQVIDHPAYFGTREENLDYLESQGKLLMLPIMYKELGIRNNKRIHDNVNPFSCFRPWPLCQCQFSKLIRGHDIGFDIETIEKLSEVI